MFFSKTNILGSQIFSDLLGPKIGKIVETGHYGQSFFRGFFSQPPHHTGKNKPWGIRSREVHMTPLDLAHYTFLPPNLVLSNVSLKKKLDTLRKLRLENYRMSLIVSRFIIIF